MTVRKTLDDLIQLNTSRRSFIQLSSALGAATMMPKVALSQKAKISTALGFQSIDLALDESTSVAQGYEVQVVTSWGDGLNADAPAFDPKNHNAEKQLQQFGYNNDYIAFMPLPMESKNSNRGILCVNHEYPAAKLMFPEVKDTKARVDTEMAAIGHSIMEVKKDGKGQWQVDKQSPYNRRITALKTQCSISGPAKGHKRMQTSQNPAGDKVIGTMGNCAGGKTPWGTVLTAEENINGYFGGKVTGRETENHERMGVPEKSWNGWEAYHDRFDVTKEPNEPNRFGWIVEIDPYNPNAMPIKRTALGRFKHEAANTTLAKDGRVVVYLGDDERFEYLYKFVTKEAYNPDNRASNMQLLDEGTLYVATFDETSIQWQPLIHGQGALTAENGFESQADVVIEARKAADLMGATPMDRPEDVDINPANGKVYVALTNNTKRTEENVANPRVNNKFGHIIEITPSNGDHAATISDWDMFILAGEDIKTQNVKEAQGGAIFANPDNLAFDEQGTVWVATDGMTKTIGMADGVYAIPSTGSQRGMARRFFNAPNGAEVCGPEFTPDNTTLFLAIQHPAEGSSYGEPSTRWPDFDESLPPRPSVVAITHRDGKKIGS